jgi:BirA family transcriptional regulator, biotin operon repressor / biotin---[acetyl-CoA-carboxylase] ligase
MNWNCILERIAETESTNDDLMVRWRAGALIDPVSRLAKHQTKGKGRSGRHWFTEPNSSLSFSLAYPFDQTQQSLHGLSLVCGLAVIQGISKSLGLDEMSLRQHGLSLKWPNDLLIKERKFGGILIEGGKLSGSNPNERLWMIIGIGMNLSHSKSLEDAAQLPISALSELNHKQMPMEADLVWLAILNALGDYLELFAKNGFAPFRSQWDFWDAYRDQPVSISESGVVKQTGIAHGINEEGALLLQEPGKTGLTAIYAGDVSLRKHL